MRLRLVALLPSPPLPCDFELKPFPFLKPNLAQLGWALSMRPINGIQPPIRLESPITGGSSNGVKADFHSGIDQFAEVLSNQVQDVNSMQVDANEMVHSLLTGGDVNEAEVLTAVQKADLAFRMLLQVRNKLIEAYREVQQIQI